MPEIIVILFFEFISPPTQLPKCPYTTAFEISYILRTIIERRNKIFVIRIGIISDRKIILLSFFEEKKGTMLSDGRCQADECNNFSQHLIIFSCAVWVVT